MEQPGGNTLLLITIGGKGSDRTNKETESGRNREDYGWLIDMLKLLPPILEVPVRSESHPAVFMSFTSFEQPGRLVNLLPRLASFFLRCRFHISHHCSSFSSLFFNFTLRNPLCIHHMHIGIGRNGAPLMISK